MHKSKLPLDKARLVAGLAERRELMTRLVNGIAVFSFMAGLIALICLIWLYVRPIKVADIKVPVATDQSSYYPGEEISGIFFGEIYYKGEVRVLREVFCKNYTNIIRPPESARNGDFYDTQSIPRKLEGLNVAIGLLPADIPVGANCVLQFTNVYNLQTPFGVRQVEYQYYTQNFSIVTKERRMQLECEATGRKGCNFLSDDAGRDWFSLDLGDREPPSSNQGQSQPQGSTYNDNRGNTNTTNNSPSNNEPGPRFEERCTLAVGGIKINCRQEQVN